MTEPEQSRIAVGEQPTISGLYIAAKKSFVELANTLSDDEWATATKCTPGWTVRDVLSHVSGIPDDGLAGRMQGAPGEAWTASQIERNRGYSVAELLERWEAQALDFATVIELMEEVRPPFDCHSHEHDVRHAIARPGNRDTVIIEAGLARLAEFDVPFDVTVELQDGRSLQSRGTDRAAINGVALRDVTPFELFRSRLGRRSREQVRGLNWAGSNADIDLVVDGWFLFGPAESPIDD
jgi:uncharacterized protein (TIGR03083 family)